MGHVGEDGEGIVEAFEPVAQGVPVRALLQVSSVRSDLKGGSEKSNWANSNAPLLPDFGKGLVESAKDHVEGGTIVLH